MDSTKNDQQQIIQNCQKADEGDVSNTIARDASENINQETQEDEESNYSDDEYGLNNKRLKIDEEVDDEVSSMKQNEAVNDERSDRDEHAHSNSSHSASQDKDNHRENDIDKEPQPNSPKKVPPLKIICTKKDFGTPYLVIDNNAIAADVSADESTRKKEENENASTSAKDEKIEESAVNSYSSASSTTSSVSCDSYVNDKESSKSNQLETKVKNTQQQLSSSSSKKERNLDKKQQQTDSSSSKNGSSKKLNQQTNASNGSSGRKNLSEKGDSNNMIRRKLRSHTRQQQNDTSNDGVLSSAPTSSSKQRLNFDDIKQETTPMNSDTFNDDDVNSSQMNSRSNERKRKQRHQQSTYDALNENTQENSAKNANHPSLCSQLMSGNDDCEATISNINNNSDGANTNSAALLANTNCIKKFIEIRSQISKRHDELIQARYKMSLPKNFEDFYLYKKNYLIASNKEARLAIPFYSVPNDVCDEMKEFYNRQEKERYNLRIRQKVEQDKLVLMYEQEVLRCFNRVSRDMNSHFSFCSIVNDDEVYNLKRDEHNSVQKPLNNCQEENPSETLQKLKEMLTEVYLKFRRIKDDLIKRQLNECDSLYAVQRMDWQSKQRDISNAKVLLNNLNEIYVPIVDVNSKLELTPVHI